METWIIITLGIKPWSFPISDILALSHSGAIQAVKRGLDRSGQQRVGSESTFGRLLSSCVYDVFPSCKPLTSDSRQTQSSSLPR